MIRHCRIQPDGAHIRGTAEFRENEIQPAGLRVKLMRGREETLPPSEAPHKIIPRTARDNPERNGIPSRRARGRFTKRAVSAHRENTQLLPAIRQLAHQRFRMAGRLRNGHFKGRAACFPVCKKRREHRLPRIPPARCGIHQKNCFHVPPPLRRLCRSSVNSFRLRAAL